MEERYPAYYDRFRCLAGACPDSCCKGDWEIVLDEDALARYNEVTGQLGQTLRDCISLDGDGEWVIAMRGGQCPLWGEDGLCRIQKELGEEALCKTCYQFPRIVQDYEAFAEHDLSMACPAAAALVLSSPAEPAVVKGTLGPWPEEAYEGQLMELLRRTQPCALELLRGDAPFAQKLERLSAYVTKVQTEINGGTEPDYPTGKMKGTRLIRFYQDLEIMTPAWRALLEEAQDRRPTREELSRVDAAAGALPLERWAAYFIRRYWCQAVADYDLQEKLQKLLAAWALLRRLLAVLCRRGGAPEAHFRTLVQLYAKEVEHDEENQEALSSALVTDPAFSAESLLLLA